MTYRDRIIKENVDKIMLVVGAFEPGGNASLSPFYKEVKSSVKSIVKSVYDSGYERSQSEFKKKRDKFFGKIGK